MHVILYGKYICTLSELFFRLIFQCAGTGLCHFCENKQSTRDIRGVSSIHLL